MRGRKRRCMKLCWMPQMLTREAETLNGCRRRSRGPGPGKGERGNGFSSQPFHLLNIVEEQVELDEFSSRLATARSPARTSNEAAHSEPLGGGLTCHTIKFPCQLRHRCSGPEHLANFARERKWNLIANAIPTPER